MATPLMVPDLFLNLTENLTNHSRLHFSAVHTEVAGGLPQRSRRELGPAVRARRRVPARAEAEAAAAPRPQEPQPPPRQPRPHAQGVKFYGHFCPRVSARPCPITS